MTKDNAIAKARKQAKDDQVVRYVVFDPTADMFNKDCRFFTSSEAELDYYYHAQPADVIFCTED